MPPSSSAATVTGRASPSQQGVPLEPVVAVMFVSGVILTIVGSGRAVATRMGSGVVASDDAGNQPIPLRIRPDVAMLLWIAIGTYGLFLAAAAIAVNR